MRAIPVPGTRPARTLPRGCRQRRFAAPAKLPPPLLTLPISLSLPSPPPFPPIPSHHPWQEQQTQQLQAAHRHLQTARHHQPAPRGKLATPGLQQQQQQQPAPRPAARRWCLAAACAGQRGRPRAAAACSAARPSCLQLRPAQAARTRPLRTGPRQLLPLLRPPRQTFPSPPRALDSRAGSLQPPPPPPLPPAPLPARSIWPSLMHLCWPAPSPRWVGRTPSAWLLLRIRSPPTPTFSSCYSWSSPCAATMPTSQREASPRRRPPAAARGHPGLRRPLAQPHRLQPAAKR